MRKETFVHAVERSGPPSEIIVHNQTMLLLILEINE